MKDIVRKVSYLGGLLEGAADQSESLELKLHKGVIEILNDLCDRIDNIDEMLSDLNDYVESIDDDLASLEDKQDDSLFDDDDEFDDFDEGEDQLHLLSPKPEDREQTNAMTACICPECSRIFLVHLSDPEGSRYVCPHCGKTVEASLMTSDNAPVALPVKE
ncbi:MAG: hypothetical protein U0L09_06595 [Christensenellales bacterium]|nr:hypothetical protein [Christensenellales bacterium]